MYKGVIFAAGLALLPASAQQSPSEPALFTRYCTGCHNAQARTGGLVLNPAANIAGDPATWEKVTRRLRMRTMPPSGSPRPDDATYAQMATWLETQLDRAAADHPNPGLPLLHRLNRTEYASAIHDLLDLDVDTSSLLPPDDAAFGFDNVADVLGVSPILLERYLSAADRISALAIGDPTTEPGSDTYRARQDLSQDQHIEGLPFGTVGGLLVEHTFPLDAEYEFRIGLFRNNLEVMRGIERPHQMELSIDDERIFLRSVGGPEDLAKMSNPTNGSDAIDARFRIRIPVKAGPHKVAVTFLQKRGESTARLQTFIRSSVDTFEVTGRPHIETVTILGPYHSTGAGDSPSRRRVLTCRPQKRAEETACARQILSRLARYAYRRPVTDADLRPLLDFYAKGRQKRDF